MRVGSKLTIPSVIVFDQAFNGESVTLEEVVTIGPTWIAIHADRSGRLGQVTGQALVWVGRWRNLIIPVDPVTVTDRLHVVLYADRGRAGVFEPSSTDGQVKFEGQPVTADFLIRDDPLPTPAASPTVFTVRITGEGFLPTRLTIPLGSSVVWVNEMSDVHTVTAEDRRFLSGSLQPGEQFNYTFYQPGQYPYYCEQWGGPGGRGMAGVIVVRD